MTLGNTFNHNINDLHRLYLLLPSFKTSVEIKVEEVEIMIFFRIRRESNK